jgi:hypothetical protein
MVTLSNREAGRRLSVLQQELKETENDIYKELLKERIYDLVEKTTCYTFTHGVRSLDYTRNHHRK